MKITLESLISPFQKNEFDKAYQSNSPFYVHNKKTILNQLRELSCLSSLDNLLNIWPQSVDAYLPGIADEINSAAFSTDQARDLFSQGHGLLFNDPNNIFEELNYILEAIQGELGLPQMTYGRSLIYAIPKGHGTAPHFDQNINFVFQVHGTKTWWLAPNEHVRNPLTRHTIGTEPDPELSSYLSSPFPESFDKEANDVQKVTLEPGSFLFVPRGYWHTTHAESDALSLNFTYSAPSWLDLFSAALRGRLAQSPHWRATADFVNDPENFKEATQQFNLLLEELKQDLPHWQAEAILNATEGGNFPPKN